MLLQTFSSNSHDRMDIDSPGSPDEAGSLYSLLDDTSKSIVKPFLTTKFIVTSRPSAAAGMFYILLTTGWPSAAWVVFSIWLSADCSRVILCCSERLLWKTCTIRLGLQWEVDDDPLALL